MKKFNLILAILLLSIIFPFPWKSSSLVAQNIAITDDDSYNANSSAMLDVKSLTKGLLVPRLTSLQRLAIVSPATGLLVFDSTLKQFLYYNGTTWLNLLTPEGDTLWNVSANSVSLANPLWNMGVGSTNPVAKLEVKGDSLAGIDDPLFAVVNKNGDTIFAVYQGGVRIYVQDDPAKASGSKGGFAVGGFSPAKGAVTNQYLHISPDSIRLYVEDVPATKATGSKGGFAVGGFSPSKVGTTNEYLRVTSDSTRIYTTDTISGFGVESLGAGTSTSYMRLTPSNYFIGHQAGDSITSGKYNSFFGYQCGLSNKGGNYNVFSGYKSGYSNIGGQYNTFIGYKSGLANEGSDNTFIGFEAGSMHEGGGGNVYLGSKAGQYDINGSQNIFIGENSGVNNLNGSQNIFMGYTAGYSNTNGNSNVMLGTQSGYSNTTGFYNTFVGYQSGKSNIDGFSNVFMGYQSGTKNTTGQSNVFLGTSAGYNNTDGFVNAFIGETAGFNNTTGTNNIFVGYQCGYNNTTSSGNVFMGRQTGYNNLTGWGNLFLGNYAGYMNTAGSSNVYLGINSGINSLGDENVCIGASANSNNVNGINNVSIGAYAGYWSVGTNNVFLGFKAGYTENGSNKLYIENSTNITSPLINGDFSTNRLAVNRQADTYPFQVGTGASNGNAAYLTNGGTWTNTSSKLLKDRFNDLNKSELLNKIENLEIQGWYYKETQEYHIGPYAEDFYNAFGTGVLNEPNYLGKSLAASDVAGVSMFAVKELIKQNKELQNQINTLKDSNNQLKAQNEQSEQKYDSLKIQVEKINNLLNITTNNK